MTEVGEGKREQRLEAQGKREGEWAEMGKKARWSEGINK